MPFLYIRTCNSDFHCVDDGADYARPEDALAAGVEGAVGIVSDEIKRGGNAAAVEICVEQEDGTRLLRSVVAISVSPLSVAPPAAEQDG